MIKTLLFVCASVIGSALPAHEVEWWENQDGSEPGNPMVFSSLDPCYLDQYIEVAPSSGEPCTVTVNLDPPTSPYISAVALLPNPDNWVDIRVTLIKQPTNATPIFTTVTGEWHATGFPAGKGCDAVNPNRFSVPIKIALSHMKWIIGYSEGLRQVSVDTGSYIGVKGSYNLTGPWMNVGKGSNFTFMARDMSYFLRGTKRLGGAITGTITDNSGSPQSGMTLGLPWGGAVGQTAVDGSFSLPGLSRGTNLIQMVKSLGFVDPNTGSNRTETAGIDVLVPVQKPFVAVQLKVEVQILPPPPACNCSPWCAIGFGSIDGAQTPVYFAGGANPPKNVPPTCGQADVVVTPPVGPAFAITPGSGRHQNSGANPASGTWTVTTTVCGQSKSCTLTVP